MGEILLNEMPRLVGSYEQSLEREHNSILWYLALFYFINKHNVALFKNHFVHQAENKQLLSPVYFTKIF